MPDSTLVTVQLNLARYCSTLKKNQNAPRPSEHCSTDHSTTICSIMETQEASVFLLEGGGRGNILYFSPFVFVCWTFPYQTAQY